MKYRALVTAEVIPSMLEKLKSNIDFDFDGYYIDHEVMPVDELKSKVKDYDILICEYDTIDKEILDCAEKLKIIIGKQGEKLKKIGTRARIEIEGLLDMKVNLKLWVKVKKDWRDSDFQLKNYGYNKRDI